MRAFPLLLLILTLGLTACDNKPSGPTPQGGDKTTPTKGNTTTTNDDNGGPGMLRTRAELKKSNFCTTLLDDATVKKAFGHPLNKKDTKQFLGMCIFKVQSSDLGGAIKVSASKSVESAKSSFARSTKSFTAAQVNDAQKGFSKSVATTIKKKEQEGKLSKDGGKVARNMANSISQGASGKAGKMGFKVPKQLETVRDNIDLGPRATMMTSYALENGKKMGSTTVYIRQGNLNARVSLGNLTQKQKKMTPILIKDIRERMLKL